MASLLKESSTTARNTSLRRNQSSASSAKSSGIQPRTAERPKTPAENVEVATEPRTATKKPGGAPTAREATPPPTQDAPPGRPPTQKKRTQALTYAQATRKTDELDSLKLTLAVMEAIASCLSDHTGIECNIEDTAKIVTATFNKIYRQDYNHTAVTRFLTKKH